MLAELAWPIVILIIVCTFKKQIGRMIDGITRAKAFGTEVEVNRQQTPEAGKKLAEELDRLKDGRIEPIFRRKKADDGPPLPLPATPEPTPASVAAPASPPQLPPVEPAPPGTAPLSWLQERVVRSITHDPSLDGLDCEEKLKRVVNIQAVYQIQLMFERTYRVIFGSQMDALRMARREEGIPLSEVEATFNNAKGLFPAIHEGRTFEQWGQFLINAGLAMEIRANGIRMAHTTEIGREFLAYIDERGYPRPVG